MYCVYKSLWIIIGKSTNKNKRCSSTQLACSSLQGAHYTKTKVRDAPLHSLHAAACKVHTKPKARQKSVITLHELFTQNS